MSCVYTFKLFDRADLIFRPVIVLSELSEDLALLNEKHIKIAFLLINLSLTASFYTSCVLNSSVHVGLTE